MRKVLFIDRDGTIIREPSGNFQVDTLEKLEFVPAVIRNLWLIRKNLAFDLVMVTNQDGLGSPDYPEAVFRQVQDKLVRTLENEGIVFDEVLVDRSLPEENAATRKPRTGMLSRYLSGPCDLAGSVVIGDRLTDLELAVNLGAKSILYSGHLTWAEVEAAGWQAHCLLITNDWDAVYRCLAFPSRKTIAGRKTRETDVHITFDPDGTGQTDIATGLGFFDHMLEQIGRHSGCDLTVKVRGDLHIDEHHTVEDTALALGEAVAKALGDKRGIERYGFVLPMDDALATVAIDFGGRPWLQWKSSFKRDKVGDMPTELFFHFFKSFTDTARCNLYVRAKGDNDHHKAEALFKAFARALRNAVRRDVFNFELPTTKGTL